MSDENTTLCRAKYLLPLSLPDRTERIEDGYILTHGESILQVGRYSPEIGRSIMEDYGSRLKIIGNDSTNAKRQTEKNIPCLNGVILPAFVKAHGHDHEQPIIGIAKDEPLTKWLDHAVNPFTAFMNSNHKKLCNELGDSPQYVTYLMARIADIHYGITTSMVHHCNYSKYHADDIARANELAGTTMIVALGSQDRHYVKDILDKPEEAIDRLEKASRIEGLKRTRFCPGPDQLFSNSRRLLVPLKKWAEDKGTLFHIHSSEEPNTTRWFKKEIEPGMTPVEYAFAIGILNENSVLAHQVNCEPNDLEILAKTKTKIVHNPLANTILGSGMPPIIEMMDRGIPVAISTDGSGSADNQNIIAAARLAAQYQKAFHRDATLLKSCRLLEMITAIPAQILRLKKGELSVGRDADFILLNLNKPNLTPTRIENVMENIIWASDGSEIDTVVANGRILKENGEIKAFPDGTRPDTIMAKVQKLSELFAEYARKAPKISETGANSGSPFY